MPNSFFRPSTHDWHACHNSGGATKAKQLKVSMKALLFNRNALPACARHSACPGTRSLPSGPSSASSSAPGSGSPGKDPPPPFSTH
eukprot:6635387-Pyramimonas_sp.AAC.1